jgi:hypothetical protein
MRGAIPPLPQYAFMAWCSVEEKALGQLYLLPFTCQDGKSHRRVVDDESVCIYRRLIVNVSNKQSWTAEKR